jgi:predicted PurR-regulated permease PerM
MTDNPYQNIDISQNNPLDIKINSDSSSIKTSKKPLSPRIIILIILGIIVFLLFIVSLIITSSRQREVPTIPKTTPTPIEENIPTTSKSLVPQIYQEKFDTIENNLENDLDINPPLIDTDIGF